MIFPHVAKPCNAYCESEKVDQVTDIFLPRYSQLDISPIAHIGVFSTSVLFTVSIIIVLLQYHVMKYFTEWGLIFFTTLLLSLFILELLQKLKFPANVAMCERNYLSVM